MLKKIYAFSAYVFIVLWTGLLSLVTIFTFKKSGQDKIIMLWSKWVLKACNIELLVENRDLIPKKSHILLFNHLSLLDIPLIYQAIGSGQHRFGAKSDLFKIPIFGLALKRSGFLPILRNDRQKTLKIYKKTAKRFQQGESFILAPEGGRQNTLKIHEFKTGPFLLAIENQVPILSVVIAGAEKINPKGSLVPQFSNKNTIKVRFIEPLATKGLKKEDRNSLKENVRESMQKTLDSLISD